MRRLEPWHGRCQLQFETSERGTFHQGGCSAPFKLLRAKSGDDGRCELPLLHTAGGLVGGDQLSIELNLKPGSRSLITSVAAQKVYGSVGRSRLHPDGAWAQQSISCNMDQNSDLEWLPQELVLYADALHQQTLTVCLPLSASFLSAEIVRLGRTAAGETLNRGCWRSCLELQRKGTDQSRWELIDRLELDQEALDATHGLSGSPVFGSLVWAAPMPLAGNQLKRLIEGARIDREGLEGQMQCSSLDQGFIARYAGHSSRDARFWFSRIWARTRLMRGLAKPRIPREWPLQEDPISSNRYKICYSQ